ncbi:MAG: hypothetical protein AAGA42_09090 [Actinomycetota bacterium]
MSAATAVAARRAQIKRVETARARPNLQVVPRRRRWPAVVAAIIWLLVFAGLLGAAVFHTQLAERQLEIDRLDRAVTAERERFDELRYQRAELRSPVRLAGAAEEMGMRRGGTGTFVEVTPDQLARQLAAAGQLDDDTVRIIEHDEPLDQFRDVKSVTAVDS